jgi:hypothetical protein
MSFEPLSRKRGRIAYRHTSGELWGFEEFAVTRDKRNCRTMNAHCEMALGQDAVVRETTMTVDPDFQPIDAYVRIWNHGSYTGSGWFRFDENEAHCESWTSEKGRISQSLAIERPMRGFGVHALIGDGWLAAPYPFEKGPGSQHFFGQNLNHSLHHLGATGPELVTSTSGLAYHGEEEVEVPAGRFACHHFALAGTVNDHPPYHFWVTSDGDFLFVRGTVEGYMDSVFELEELSG